LRELQKLIFSILKR